MRIAERRQDMISRTRADRASAEALLRSLVGAREASSRGLKPMRRPDLLGSTPSSVAIDAAIDGVRGLIATYTADLDTLLRDLTDADLTLLDEIALPPMQQARAA